MATVSVPVLKPLSHQGRSYVRGELITLEAIDAAALARKGLVTLTKGANISTRVLTAEKPAAPPRRRGRPRKQTYRTTHLEAATEE